MAKEVTYSFKICGVKLCLPT